MTEIWTCPNCLIEHRVGQPATKRAEVSRCGMCGQKEWIAGLEGHVTLMGVFERPDTTNPDKEVDFSAGAR